MGRMFIFLMGIPAGNGTTAYEQQMHRVYSIRQPAYTT